MPRPAGPTDSAALVDHVNVLLAAGQLGAPAVAAIRAAVDSVSATATNGPINRVGIAVLLTVGRALDALTLGEDAAASLGVDLARTRLAVVAGTALSVGAATAVTGIIGFVGLIVPHVLRPLARHRPGLLLPASFFGGATMLLLADVALRLVQTWVELRIGVLTALIGAPFFVWLVLKTRSELAP